MRPLAKTEKWVYLILACLATAYVAIRSFTVPLANDEAATFFTFVHTGDFIPFVSDYWSANNHYLNTALTWLSYQLFGVQEWVLRLPNVLALLLFFCFTFNIGKQLKSQWLRWIFWLALFGSHYMLEFFGYSRGYGLSIAFLMGGIHFSISRESKPNYRYWALAMMTLAVFSNLNLLLSYLIWLAVMQLSFFDKFNWKRWLGFNLLATALISAPIAISFILKSKEELYIGQPSLSKTFHTLMTRFVGTGQGWGLGILIALVGVMLLLAVILVLREQRKAIKLDGLMLFAALFGLNLLAVQLLSVILGVLFPSERTAMHWMPLFIGMAVFSLDALEGTRQKLAAGLMTLALSPVFLFGLSKLNLKISSDPHWALEQTPDSFYFAVQQDGPSGEFPRSVSSSTSLNTFTWAFKNLKYQGGLDACVDFKFWNPEYVADYLILDLKEFKDFPTVYDTLIHDPFSNATLLKRKKLLDKKPLNSQDTSSTVESNSEWFMLADWPMADSLVGKAIRLDYDLLVNSPVHPLPSLVTLELRDSLNQTTHYNQFRLNYFKTDFSDQQPIRASLTLDSVPAGTTRIRTLLWNIKSKPFTLNSCRVDYYQLVEN